MFCGFILYETYTHIRLDNTTTAEVHVLLRLFIMFGSTLVLDYKRIRKFTVKLLPKN